MKKKPIVSIGMTVHNDEKRLPNAIETILNQSFKDFELIISDNASTDNTENICHHYQNKDSRVNYFRQSRDMGGPNNFVFVYKQAIGEFFMWAPSHYSRSLNFIEECLKVLKSDLNCNFVSTPNCWIEDENKKEKYINFSLEGSVYKRISKFLDLMMNAHACFYGLFRRSNMQGVEDLSEGHIAVDTLFMMKNLLKSEFKRTKSGLLIVGRGQSSRPEYITTWQTKFIHYILPLYDFTKNALITIMKSRDILFYAKIILFLKLIFKNIIVHIMIIKYWFKKIYNLKY